MRTMFLMVLLLAACALAPEAIEASANMRGTIGHGVSGVVTFSSHSRGIEVKGELHNLTPGLHGFHIHENGQCGPDGSAAGGHFNPFAQPHGARTDDVRHVGDLGNIRADKDGVAKFEFVDDHISFYGQADIRGKALIVHADADDFSQPSGNAGARVACGIIN